MNEITADALLDGPRGRRLCFELLRQVLRERAAADEGEQWRASAVFYAAYEADPGRGRSRVLFGPGGNRVPKGFGSVELAVEAVTGIDLPEVEGAMLWDALIAAVDRAAYWQPPDGEDVLAAHPGMREALLRVAERIATSPHAGGWDRSIGEPGTAQFAIDWTDRPEVGAPGKPAALILQEWGVRVREMEERARRERPRNVRARWSGEWWSMPPHGLIASTRALGDCGPIGLHLVEDSLGPEEATVRPIGILPDARLAVIRTPDDWARLCRAFPLAVTAEKRHDWYRATGRDGEWVMPDWERVAEHHDGVQVTVLGYLRSAGRAIEVGDGRASVIAGWNPDATYWLTDRVRVWDEPEHWRRIEPNTHPDPAAWRRVD